MGKGMIGHLSREIPAGSRVMITFGGGSVRANRVYDQVKEALKDYYTVEFWGIEPNQTVKTIRSAVELGKREKTDFLLAVGGGSVLDGTKMVAAALLSDKDPWDLVLSRNTLTVTVPLGTVLTLPATGSEMNRNAVISRKETQENMGLLLTFRRFLFSILRLLSAFLLIR